MRSDKIAVHVSRLPGGATPKHDYCRLSFRYERFFKRTFYDSATGVEVKPSSSLSLKELSPIRLGYQNLLLQR